MSEARKGKCTGKNHHNYGKHLSREIRKKIADAKTGVPQSLEARRNRINTFSRQDYREKRRSIGRELWTRPEFVAKQMKARNTHPNFIEKIFNDQLSMLQYVGDGKLIIGRKCPDFVLPNTNKLVELFGNYWHEKVDESQKISYFRTYGYETLVVWIGDVYDTYTHHFKKEKLGEIKEWLQV